MPKNIVICSDGTGNSANKDGGTNVFKLFEAVDLTGHADDPPELPEQIAFYDDGVGTESFKPLRILGGAVGWGLSKNVRQLYAALVRSYKPGDRIYLFGFSRGAFTVRTLGGFITSCGILKNEYETDAALCNAVKDVYRVYRSGYIGKTEELLRRTMGRSTVRKKVFEQKKKGFDERHRTHDAKIAFIGVWDTVDAVGLPFDHFADFLNLFYRFKFSDLRLSDKVEGGCHAVAIDDERHTFHPVMWEETERDKGRISQVWFPGVHSNVGGGYPKQGMSLVSLDWMMTQAESARLRFYEGDREWVREHANVNDKLYNSRAGLAMYYRYKPRDIGRICALAGIGEPMVHESAIERVRQQTEGYSPGNLPRTMQIVATHNPASRHAGKASAIAAGYAGANCLLDRVEKLVFLRRISHYIFVVLSLALVWALISPQISHEKGVWSVIASIVALDGNSIVQGYRLNPYYGISLTALTLGFLALQIWIEGRLQNGFSRFWRNFWRPAPDKDEDESVVPQSPA
jgi:uncharacterized protein (DUF2235 family)